MNNTNINIRLEHPSDYRISEEVIREAFWNRYQPGADEHYLLHKLRNHKDFIPELCYIAEIDNIIVGCIAYFKSKVIDLDGNIIEVASFGPIGVLPDYQKHGVGKALIAKTVNIAKELGYPAVIIYGDLRYYGRNGFRGSERYGIMTSKGSYSACLMVYALDKSIFNRDFSGGYFHESELFENWDGEGLEEYDSTFPQKEKVDTVHQKLFNVLKTLTYPSNPWE